MGSVRRPRRKSLFSNTAIVFGSHEDRSCRAWDTYFALFTSVFRYAAMIMVESCTTNGTASFPESQP
jgi:hypothetical protein